jgi:hypothetical protein
MVLGNLALIAGCRVRGVPFDDEWDLLPPRVTPQWLWAQHAEHRAPLAKLLWTGVNWLTDYDLRVGNFLSILAAGAVALALVRAAQRLRGRAAFADAFFPLALLNPGQGFNFFCFWQVTHLLPAYLSCALLLVVARRGKELGRRGVALVGLFLLVLPFCGPAGLPYAVMMALWLGLWGVASLRAPEPQRRRQGLCALGLGAAGVLLVGLYFVGYDYDPNRQAGVAVLHPGVPAALVTASHVFGVSFGLAAFPDRQYVGPAALGLVLATLAVLAAAWRTRPSERCRILGLALFLGATCALMLVVSWARCGIGEAYLFFHGQFLPYCVPALFCCYFVWQFYGRPRGRLLVQWGLPAVACAFLLRNVRAERHWLSSLSEGEAAFARDLRTGAPLSVLAENHALLVHHERVEGDRFVQRLAAYHREGLGVFRHLRLEFPPHQVISVPVRPAAVHHMSWGDGVGRVTGNDARLVFDLNGPRFVYAVRLRCSYEGAGGDLPALHMFWANAGQPFSKERSRHLMVQGGPQEHTVTLWVADTIDQFRVDPHDRPCVFRVTGIELLVPDDG